MFYRAAAPGNKDDRDMLQYLCYASPDDGIKTDKPALTPDPFAFDSQTVHIQIRADTRPGSQTFFLDFTAGFAYNMPDNPAGRWLSCD